ncbi:hypothetical protein Bca4012_018506 [Brassica carinata]
MNRFVESLVRGGSSQHARRRLQDEEEEIIWVPACDNSDLIENFKRTLVRKMFHYDGRSVEAILNHMPKCRIWDVLQRRPSDFNKWSFSLEKWIPTIKEDFPKTLALWAEVSGVPIHYRKEETYQSVGNALGVFDKADVDGGRVHVFVNGDQPLKFDCKVGFENGHVVKVKMIYEDLHHYCFSCKRISHEEGTCLELIDKQREQNCLLRIEQKKIKKSKRGVKTFPSINVEAWNMLRKRQRIKKTRIRKYEKRHPAGTTEIPRYRAIFHPYQNNLRAGSKERYRDMASSFEWRVKEPSSSRYESYSRKYAYTASKSEWKPVNIDRESDMAPGEQPRIVAAGRLVSGRLETPRTNEALDSSVVKPKNLMVEKDTELAQEQIGTRDAVMEDIIPSQIISKETERKVDVQDIENQRDENDKDDRKIEVISQLSPEAPRNKVSSWITKATSANIPEGNKERHMEVSNTNLKERKKS